VKVRILVPSRYSTVRSMADIPPLQPLPADEEQALRERVAEQARLEQEHDVQGLCELVLPEYRASAEELSGMAASFGEFVARVRSVELVSFEVEAWWEPKVASGESRRALVRSMVRYNGSPEPARFRAPWVRVDGIWHTTATGKMWPPSASASD